MMNTYYKENPEVHQIEVVYEEGKDWGNIIGWLLPLVIIIAFWVIMMRRMGGGGPMGGGGGNIFNIGKSKAVLFEDVLETDAFWNHLSEISEEWHHQP